MLPHGSAPTVKGRARGWGTPLSPCSISCSVRQCLLIHCSAPPGVLDTAEWASQAGSASDRKRRGVFALAPACHREHPLPAIILPDDFFYDLNPTVRPDFAALKMTVASRAARQVLFATFMCAAISSCQAKVRQVARRADPRERCTWILASLHLRCASWACPRLPEYSIGEMHAWC